MEDEDCCPTCLESFTPGVCHASRDALSPHRPPIGHPRIPAATRGYRVQVLDESLAVNESLDHAGQQQQQQQRITGRIACFAPPVYYWL